MIMPPDTPETNAAEYILTRDSVLLLVGESLDSYAMTVPLSCKKKTSAIERGAIVSAAPDPNPMRIRAAKKLPYVYVHAAQIAHIKYRV